MLSFFSQDNTAVLYDFQAVKSVQDWYVVDDGVMGGLSEGAMSLNSKGNGVFSGDVSTRNNGGFSSIRYNFETMDASDFTHVVLKVKGDGKSYQFRIKESRRQRHSFIASFQTSGDWETIRLPFKDFYAGFRGYQLDIPNYSGETMQEIAILIGNKRNESFALEIERISLE